MHNKVKGLIAEAKESKNFGADKITVQSFTEGEPKKN